MSLATAQQMKAELAERDQMLVEKHCEASDSALYRSEHAETECLMRRLDLFPGEKGLDQSKMVP